MPEARKLSAFRELALANWRELIRDPSGLFLLIAFPMLIFGLMLLVGLSGDGPPGGGPQGGPPGNGLQDGPPGHGPQGDLVRMMLPFTLFLFYMLLGFYTLGYQTVQLRQQGTLRLLGLTPLKRLTFILAQLPSRLLLALGQLLLIAIAGIALGALDLGQLPGLVFGSLLGILLFFSLAYFVGGIVRIPEAAIIVPMLLMPLVMFSAGLFPLGNMPAWLTAIGPYSPFTYWFDLINHWLIGTPLQHSVGLSVTVIMGTAAVVTGLTAATFRWDQGET